MAGPRPSNCRTTDAKRRAPDPEAAAFVADQVSPSAGAGGLCGAVPAIRNRPGSGDDDDAGLVGAPASSATSASLTTSVARLVADPAHDAADGVGIRRPIDAGDTEADRGGRDIMVRHRGFHDAVQHFLDLELPDRLQVRSAAACFGDDVALIVREQTDGLGALPRRFPGRACIHYKVTVGNRGSRSELGLRTGCRP